MLWIGVGRAGVVAAVDRIYSSLTDLLSPLIIRVCII